MATAIAPPMHPYLEEIERLFYNYRVANFNLRYYSAVCIREKRKSLGVQVWTGFTSVFAFALYSLIPTFPVLTLYVAATAAVASAIAFFLSVAASLYGWSQKIEELTTHVHAWHYAVRQLESGIRFLRHDAQSKRDAMLQVQFAEEAFRTADNLPDIGARDKTLELQIQQETDEAFPADYVWTAL
jgi:hypothetical protein